LNTADDRPINPMGQTMLNNPNYIEDEIRNGDNQGYTGQSAQQKKSQMDRHS
jgi:hypothetical protein